MFAPEIRTERLQITIYTSDHIAALLREKTQQEFIDLMGLVTEEEYRKYQKRYDGGNDYLDFRIFILSDAESGGIVGSFSYHVWVLQHRRAEIGYRILPAYQNRGLAKEAIRAIVHHGFEDMNLNRIEAFVAPENKYSQNVVESQHFSQEGVMREHYFYEGKFDDSICYALLRSEYDQHKKTK